MVARLGRRDLLSDRTTMRARYRAADDRRVDVLSAAGETGVHRDAGGSWTWRDIVRGRGLQAVDVVVLLGAAWANFTTKDVTS